MQRLADDLVGHVRAVEIAGVDMIHAARDSLAQHGERGVTVLRRTEHARAGELHRAIAHAIHVAVAEAESLVGHVQSPVFHCAGYARESTGR